MSFAVGRASSKVSVLMEDAFVEVVSSVGVALLGVKSLYGHAFVTLVEYDSSVTAENVSICSEFFRPI